MGLADTAKLVAALELQDKFSGPAGRIDRSIGGMERSVSSLGKVGQTASRGIGNLATNLLKIGTVGVIGGVGLLATQVRAGTDALHELENVTVATSTVLKSTGGVAGVTADEVRGLSER